MRTREIGNDQVGRVEVGAVGLGLMTFDQTGPQPREQLLETVRAALDAGVTLFDTADAYGPGEEKGADAQGENERLVVGLLDELGVRDQVLLATKGGHVRTDGGGWATDSRPEHLHAAVDASLERLGVEQLALWQHHRPDPDVPYDEVIGTLGEIAAVRARCGWSGCRTPTLNRSAQPTTPSAARWSACRTSSRPATAAAARRSTSARSSAWPSCRGARWAGLSSAKGLADEHAAFKQVADARGVSAQQVALAWELAQSPVVIPIPGAKRPGSITDSAAAADLELGAEELAVLDAG